MNTIPQDLAVLRAALAADEALFTHRAACPVCRSDAQCQQAEQLHVQAAKLRGVALGGQSSLAELDTIMRTAESIVRDIEQVVRAGHLDHDTCTAHAQRAPRCEAADRAQPPAVQCRCAQAAFQCWISEALLQQPTTHQIDLLCRAAGLPMSDRVLCGRWATGAAGPVDVDTMKQRVDDLHATISGLRCEPSECATQRAALHSAGQMLVERWAHSELAQAVQTLAILLPSRQVVHDESTSQ